MNKEFIPYQQALELKELGFHEDCAAHFQNVGDSKPKWKQYDDAATFVMELRLLQAPLYQQAFRWFREKYGLEYIIESDNWQSIIYRYRIYAHHFGELVWNESNYSTHEEAELACLKELIEITKTNNL